MKKVISLLLILLLWGSMTISVTAAPEEPVITMQPQSPCYNETGTAMYTVKATGTNLTATWYIEYEGETYTVSANGETREPWEDYVTVGYAVSHPDASTFTFVIEGIEKGLDGAEVWCEIEDGHYSVPSQVGHIMVGNYGTPPEILEIPVSISVKQGEEAEIRCVARSGDGSQLEFLWYETGTGKFEDMRAVNRGTETSDYMFCDTSTVGTSYYVCGITTSGGGMAYSSMVEVNVLPKTTAAEPEILTKTLPNATVGTLYDVQLQCSDPDAEFFPYYNPGGKNDLAESTWLGLSADGRLMGTPVQAGTYGFSVCAMSPGGETYMTYTLVVEEASQTETTEPTGTTEPSGTADTTAPGATEQEVHQGTEPAETDRATIEGGQKSPSVVEIPLAAEQSDSIPWWILVAVALGAVGIGVGVAFILIKKK